MQQEYDSNFYRTRDNPEEVWISTVSPSFTLSSRGQNDGLTLRYEPGYSRNLTADTYQFNHNAHLSFNQNLSSRVRVSASDFFSKSNDPERARVAEIDLADHRGRRTYWVNTGRLEGAFAYQQNCLLTLGYTNNFFHDEVQESNNYERHLSNVSIVHQFTQYWQTNVAYAYTSGDFSHASDLVIHAPSLTINYAPTQNTRMFGAYGYSKTDYEESLRGDVTQNGTIGLSYAFDPNTTGSFSAGKYYVATKYGADNDSNAYNISLTKRYQNAELALSGNSGVENRQFSAAGEGNTKFRTARGSGSYRFAEGWAFGVDAFFRKNQYIDTLRGQIVSNQDQVLGRFVLTLEGKEENFGGSVNISCSFLRWYRMSLRYLFNEVNADFDNNDYQDHRVLLELGAAKEFWRW